MNYELAKKLKEAGFPFKTKRKCEAITEPSETNTGIIYATQTPDLPENMDGIVDIWLIPTLSELIEACGNGFQSLINNKEEGWIAFTNRKDETGERMETEGKTPEESVARLYLKLHEKTT